jgi:hypothetical protein
VEDKRKEIATWMFRKKVLTNPRPESSSPWEHPFVFWHHKKESSKKINTYLYVLIFLLIFFVVNKTRYFTRRCQEAKAI